MKTIKAIKSTKNVELGTIKRVGEKEAESEVKNGYWKYVPKSEYKGEKSTQPTNGESPKESSKTKKTKNGK
jgi:hypothetical protein